MSDYQIISGHTIYSIGAQLDKLKNGFIPAAGGFCYDGHEFHLLMWKKPKVKKQAAQIDYPELFESAWIDYPKRAGANSKKVPIKHGTSDCRKTVKTTCL